MSRADAIRIVWRRHSLSSIESIGPVYAYTYGGVRYVYDDLQAARDAWNAIYEQLIADVMEEA